MKNFLIVYCALVTIGRGQDVPGLLREGVGGIGAKCVAESGASEADIEEIRTEMPPSRREGKCLLSCIERLIGVRHDDAEPMVEGMGSIIMQRLHEVNPPLYATIMEIGLRCGPTVYAMDLKDPCDLANEMASCGVKEGAAATAQRAFGAFILNM